MGPLQAALSHRLFLTPTQFNKEKFYVFQCSVNYTADKRVVKQPNK